MSVFDKVQKLLEEGKKEEANKLLSDHIAGEVSGLKNKNEELLGSIRALKDEKNDITKRLDAIENEKRKAEEDAAAKSGDVDKIRQQLEERHKRELDKLTGERDKLKGQLDSHVIGEGLTQALVKANVSAPLMDAAKALIKSNFKGEVGDNDGKPFAKFDGKAVDEFVTDWAQSDSGKHFVSANANNGGGSNGANGNGKADADVKTMSRSEFEGLSPMDKSKLSREGVSLTDD